MTECGDLNRAVERTRQLAFRLERKLTEQQQESRRLRIRVSELQEKLLRKQREHAAEEAAERDVYRDFVDEFISCFDDSSKAHGHHLISDRDRLTKLIDSWLEGTYTAERAEQEGE